MKIRLSNQDFFISIKTKVASDQVPKETYYLLHAVRKRISQFLFLLRCCTCMCYEKK